MTTKGLNNVFPAECQIALKEWAVAVQALGRGEQILLLRKGGIREESKDFRVIHPDFLLYPTFEHQQEALLKEQHHNGVLETTSQADGSDKITFSFWARVEEVIEVSEEDRLEKLYPLHIWTQDYAQKRLHWKPRHPLSIMLLRLYRLTHPRTETYLPRYGGCKSWVELSESVPLGNLTPVLGEAEFLAMAGEVKKALGNPPLTSVLSH